MVERLAASSWVTFRRPSSAFSIAEARRASWSERSKGPSWAERTQKVSSALPLERVKIRAASMLAPATAMAPAMRLNRPGWSAV